MRDLLGAATCLLLLTLGSGCPGNTPRKTYRDSHITDLARDTGTTWPDSRRIDIRRDSRYQDVHVTVPPKSVGGRCYINGDCNQSGPLPLVCYIEPGATQGFCTHVCDTHTDCNDGPAGTKFGCILTGTYQGQAFYFCGFTCRLGTQYWPCPSTLVCKTVPNIPDEDDCY
jgi:hypothetical protein